jgi:hypothetical protein
MFGVTLRSHGTSYEAGGLAVNEKANYLIVMDRQTLLAGLCALSAMEKHFLPWW